MLDDFASEANDILGQKPDGNLQKQRSGSKLNRLLYLLANTLISFMEYKQIKQPIAHFSGANNQRGLFRTP